MNKTNSLFILLIAVFGIFILVSILSPQTSEGATNLNETSSEILSETTNSQLTKPPVKDTLISKCENSLNECLDIGKMKYGYSSSILKNQEFENFVESKDFYNTWKAPLQIYLEADLKQGMLLGDTKAQEEMPIVLFAISIKGVGGQTPYVILCNKRGELGEMSKVALMC